MQRPKRPSFSLEVDARRVLVEAGGETMLGLIDGHAVDMIDLLADGVIGEAMHGSGEDAVIMPRAKTGRHAQPLGGDMVRKVGHHRV